MTSVLVRPYIQIVQKRLPAPPLMWRIDMIVFSFTIAVLLYLFMIVSGYPHGGGLGPDLPHLTNTIALRNVQSH